MRIRVENLISAQCSRVRHAAHGDRRPGRCPMGKEVRRNEEGGTLNSPVAASDCDWIAAGINGHGLARHDGEVGEDISVRGFMNMG